MFFDSKCNVPSMTRANNCRTMLKTATYLQVSIKDGDECTILNNTDSDNWQIRCTDGTEAEVPGIILVIPPPDKKAYNEAQRYANSYPLTLFNERTLVT